MSKRTVFTPKEEREAAIELERLRDEFAKAAKRLSRAKASRGRATNGASVDVRTSEFEQARGAYFAARSTFAERNLRLVYHVAKRYCNAGLSRDDLIQEGVIGLITAIDRFDYRKGKFSTCAVWWIQTRLREALAGASAVPIGRGTFERCGRVSRAIGEGLQKTGERPAIREIESATNIPCTQLERLINSGVLELRTVSLSALFRHSDLSLQDVLPIAGPTPLELLEQKDTGKVASRLTEVLNAREREVIRLRFEGNLTFRQIGERIGCSHELARQIEETSLAKMAEAGRAEFETERDYDITAYNY